MVVYACLEKADDFSAMVNKLLIGRTNFQWEGQSCLWFSGMIGSDRTMPFDDFTHNELHQALDESRIESGAP
jgi:hypothetical protein